ncbi:hypothetical protein HK405_011402, partial [Cladochytrium tenue]
MNAWQWGGAHFYEHSLSVRQWPPHAARKTSREAGAPPDKLKLPQPLVSATTGMPRPWRHRRRRWRPPLAAGGTAVALAAIIIAVFATALLCVSSCYSSSFAVAAATLPTADIAETSPNRRLVARRPLPQAAAEAMLLYHLPLARRQDGTDPNAPPDQQQQPADASQQPQPDTQQLDASQQNAVQQQPDTSQQQPDVSQQQPDVSQQQPDISQQQPDVSQQQPDVSQQQPDVSQQQPDASQQQPDASQQQPDASQQQPDASLQNAAVQQQPDASQQQPDASQQQADASQQPDTSQNAAAQPDASQQSAGELIIHPEEEAAPLRLKMLEVALLMQPAVLLEDKRQVQPEDKNPAPRVQARTPQRKSPAVVRLAVLQDHRQEKGAAEARTAVVVEVDVVTTATGGTEVEEAETTEDAAAAEI